MFVWCQTEPKQLERRAHDQRVQGEQTLLTADRAHRLRFARGRQRGSMRLASAYGFIFVRLRRGGLSQSAQLLEGCGASWWVLSELVDLGGTALRQCLRCVGVRRHWSELRCNWCARMV